MTASVIIHEELNNVQQIDIDIHPRKYEIFKILGKATFIGQWPDYDVVIMKSENGVVPNQNTLPYPFHNETVKGKILLLKMDENSEHKPFELQEFISLRERMLHTLEQPVYTLGQVENV